MPSTAQAPTRDSKKPRGFITEAEERVLAALAAYRFLTAKQMLRLGVAKAASHLYRTLRSLELRTPHVVVKLDFGIVPIYGKLDNIYALTRRGAELLMGHPDFPGGIEVARDVRHFASDYFHRRNCVDFHIALSQWAERSGQTIDFFHAYYDPGSGDPRKGDLRQKTHIKLSHGALVPDAVFALSDGSGVQRLFTFELYNQRRTARVASQLATYTTAIKEEAIKKAYNYRHEPRVLLVFEDEEGMRLVAQRLRALPAFGQEFGYAPWFFLAPLPAVEQDLLSCWQRFSGERATLF